MRRLLPCLAALVLLSVSCGTNGGEGETYREDWFREARYGVMVHFLRGFLGGGADWNEQVDAFDVEGFAEQMRRARAGYVLITLGQNSGYYCSPNAAYDRYTGYAAGDRCSVRDLPMELADALARRGIPLMLYLPSRAPQGDLHAAAGLGDLALPNAWGQLLPAPQEFTRRWSEVIEEWSQRYGTKVRGWWFDGSYNTNGWDDVSKPYNWNTWAAACRAGNPNSILAFNRGTFPNQAFRGFTTQQDYTAGEQNDFTATPQTHPATPGLQWHLLGHLGSIFGEGDGPQLSDADMVAYIGHVNAEGGVVTLDVHVTDGSVYGPHLRQLEAIGRASRQDLPSLF